jgi:cation transport regulator ChaB
VTSAEFDKILGHKELPAEFRKELMDHHTDWIEEMSEEAFQQYLDKQNNHTLFPVT